MYDTKRGRLIHKAADKLNLCKRTLYHHLKNGITLETIKQEMVKFDDDKLLKFKEVALILNCHKSSVYYYAVVKGKLPYYAIFGTNLRIKVKDLNEFIKNRYLPTD